MTLLQKLAQWWKMVWCWIQQRPYYETDRYWNQRFSDSLNYKTMRKWEWKKLKGMSVLEAMVHTGMTPSLSEARRKMKEGAILMALTIEPLEKDKDGAIYCEQLTKDEPLCCADMIVLGKKRSLWIYKI